MQADMLLQQVHLYRREHPSLGVRKLYNKLQPFMQENDIQIGRDKLFNLVSEHNLLIRKRKKRVRTTQSYHLFRKYPNQIKDFVATAPNQLWVSDITYWPIGEKYGYISLITDAYSHKIIGYQVGESLATEESLKALRMALSSLGGEGPINLIHHSDRGIQYCSKEYVCLLESHQIVISMSRHGDPLENAIAERVNGIIKEEYLSHYAVNTLAEAKQRLERVVQLYNEDRPHMSIGNYTPSQAHSRQIEVPIEKLWKNYYQAKLVSLEQE